MNFKDTLPGVFLCVAMFACGHARANMLVYPMAAEINSSREEAVNRPVLVTTRRCFLRFIIVLRKFERLTNNFRCSVFQFSA
ncbi:hypothetical protein F1331_23945 [Salmonella enterica subsp. enterica serovar Dessau]|uniref:Fimbrial protein n=1 Tax=Salmonella enterica subsp. enterica serovar Dessau TaxID=2564349 RepID=A0A8E5MYG9_SALET|nr:hypothetical protein F1331_23945 [Salmonella enterica subsp. enterica serovar Dessau]